jgi:hypothetical protein
LQRESWLILKVAKHFLSMKKTAKLYKILHFTMSNLNNEVGRKPLEFQDVPGWRFTVDEVSAGVYKVNGIDEAKHSVERVGTDPDLLIEDCKEYAKMIASQKSV